jgi:hypothetical protein
MDHICVLPIVQFTGILGSNHARGINVCFVLFFVGRGLCDGLINRLKDFLITLRNVQYETAKVLTRTLEPLIIILN